MKSQKLSFKNKEGIQLSARLDLPIDEKPVVYALFAHCFTCSKNLTAVRNISRSLTSNGIAVLLFDFTGLGESEGDFESTTFTSNIHDLFAASNYMTEQFEAPKILIGHSLGGAAVLFAGKQMENIEAVVTIAAPFDPYHVTHLIAEDINTIKEKGRAEVNIGGRPFTIAKSFIDDISQHNAEEVAKELRKALLIMHSPQDTTVGIDNAAKIYLAAHHPKSFVSLDGADHLLTKKEDSLYVGNVIATWVRKYIDAKETEKKKLTSKSKVVVSTEQGGYLTDIKAGSHYLLADEPKEVGGSDMGPTPYDYLSAALGACTTMTLQMYANRKGWDLKEAKVHINHNKDYIQDCEDCEEPNAKIDHFDREIELIGDLDESQKMRLLEIADKCPVHKTLHSKVKVVSTLKA